MRRTQVRRSDESNCSNAAVGEFLRRHQIFQLKPKVLQAVVMTFLEVTDFWQELHEFRDRFHLPAALLKFPWALLVFFRNLCQIRAC
jgi:hypothetical protein